MDTSALEISGVISKSFQTLESDLFDIGNDSTPEPSPQSPSQSSEPSEQSANTSPGSSFLHGNAADSRVDERDYLAELLTAERQVGTSVEPLGLSQLIFSMTDSLPPKHFSKFRTYVRTLLYDLQNKKIKSDKIS